MYKLIVLLIGINLIGCKASLNEKETDQDIGEVTDSSKHTNYGYNIVVVSDLSNRILNKRAYDDPQILQLITSKLKALFQKSADVGINSKFFFTTVNDQDFSGLAYNDSIFKIDLTRFKNNITQRADYLHHRIGKGSLQHDIEALNSGFRTLYDQVKMRKQLPADMWYFFKDKLSFPIIDSTSTSYPYKGKLVTNKFKNYVIILTDGYIEAGRYAENNDMRQNNQFRFLSEALVGTFRDEYKRAKRLTLNDFFSRNQYGILPVDNGLLNDCKVLVLELFDRSVKNGVNTQNPTDLEILKMFWNDWLFKSTIDSTNITIHSSFSNKQNLDIVIDKFFGAY